MDNNDMIDTELCENQLYGISNDIIPNRQESNPDILLKNKRRQLPFPKKQNHKINKKYRHQKPSNNNNNINNNNSNGKYVNEIESGDDTSTRNVPSKKSLKQKRKYVSEKNRKLKQIKSRPSESDADSNQNARSSSNNSSRTGKWKIQQSSRCSLFIKYLVFFFNVLFWFVGLSLIIIGIWAWSEKDVLGKVHRLSNGVFLDPVTILIIVGIIVFIVGFAGCLGALRENICLLSTFSGILAFIFIAQVAGGIFLLMNRTRFVDEMKKVLKKTIIGYRVDIDLQNLLDWVQYTWLGCCGIDGYNDWEANIYFNCSSEKVGSIDACGVPFSCCVKHVPINKRCGADVRRFGKKAIPKNLIHTEGCIKTGEAWIEKNILMISVVIVVIAVVEILAICFAQNLRNDILHSNYERAKIIRQQQRIELIEKQKLTQKVK
ncbi:hypothetical protein SNEBB_007556 [Seison nebaliae]|nr:hypothetical protein SNEBB_007556 [Seison nebaliae]